MSDNFVTTLLEDQAGSLWVGTFNYGLNRYDRANDRFERFLNQPDDPGSLINNTILDLLEDQAGNIWIGTAAGLDRFEPQAKTFTHFTENNGLPNNTVYAMLEDEAGAIWLTTNRGISKSKSPG